MTDKNTSSPASPEADQRPPDPSEPKPCPLCGGPAYATRTVNGTQMFKVGCAACGLELKAAWYRDADKPTKDILTLWNSRLPLSASRTSEPPFTENETKDVLTALYQDGHVDLVLADRIAALMGSRTSEPTPAEPPRKD